MAKAIIVLTHLCASWPELSEVTLLDGISRFLPSFNATVIVSEVTVNWLCQSFGLTLESTDPSRVTLNPAIWGHQKSGHSIQPRTNRSLRLFVPFWNVQGRVFRSTGLSIR
jgi:hypothetical protein